MDELNGYMRGRGHEEEIWADILFQLETSSLAVVRGALITSNAEMLFREDMPFSIVSRLLEVLVNELVISSDENLRSKSIGLLTKKMEQIFGNDSDYDPCPLLSAIELHLNSCLDNNVRSDLVVLISGILEFLPKAIIQSTSLLSFLSAGVCPMKRSQLSQSSGLTGFASLKALQENRDHLFAKLFRTAQEQQILCDNLEILRFDLLASILHDSVTWDSRDFDADLKASAVSLAINLCIYEGSDGADGQRKAVKMVVNNECICSTLKKYILGRNKDEQEIGLNALLSLTDNSGKQELHLIYSHDFPTLLLECLKPKTDNCLLILEVLRSIINKSAVSSFSGENALDVPFEVGIGNFWSVGKWSADVGDSVILLRWYKVFEDLLSSTVVLSDLNAAVEASAFGLAISYNPEVLHAAWSCMIRFCSSERFVSCPSLLPALIHSCSLIKISNYQNEHSSALFLHESALFVFMNCLRNVFLYGWCNFSPDFRAIMLKAIEQDVVQGIMAAFEVVADQTVAAFYDVLCTILEYDQSESDLDSWACNWCKTASQAGFLSTLVESLGIMSMIAPVTKNAARLLYQILLHLGFAAPSQKQYFEILSSAGSFHGFIVRVLQNFGKKEWAESGMMVVSAILAGAYSNQDFRTCEPCYSSDWISFAIHNASFLFEDEGDSANNHQSEEEIVNPIKDCLAQNILTIEKALVESAHRLEQSREPAPPDCLFILLRECERSGPIPVDLISWLLDSNKSDQRICQICMRSLLHQEICGEGGEETRNLIPHVISSNENCAGYIIELLHQDQDTIVKLLEALQTSLDHDAVTILVKEGLIERLNRILLGDPSIEALHLVLMTLQKVLGSRRSNDLVSSFQLGSTLQCICNKLFAFIKKFAFSRTDGLNASSDQSQYFSAATTLMILATVCLKNLDGADTTQYLEDRGQIVLRMLLENSRLRSQCCFLCFTILLKTQCDQTNYGRQDVSNQAGNSDQCQLPTFGSDLLLSFYDSVQKMLFSEGVSWKGLAIVCIAFNTGKQQYPEQIINGIVTDHENAKRLRDENLLEGLVAIQNALMDPMWNLNLKLLALVCLETILSESSAKISDSLVSLEWFRVLGVQAFSSIRICLCETKASWLPWVVYLKVVSKHFLRLNSCELYSRTNLDILQELTFKCRCDWQSLSALASVWIQLLTARNIIVDAERARELKTYFMSVFNEVSCRFAGKNTLAEPYDSVIPASETSIQDAIPDTIICGIIDRLDPQHCSEKENLLNLIVEIDRLLTDYQAEQQNLYDSGTPLE